MTLKYKILIVCAILALSFIIYMESNKPEPINWLPTYSKSDKIPLGSYVAFETLRESRGKINLKEVNQPPYEFLKDSLPSSGSYFFLNDYIGFDEAEAKRLLSWTSKGNTLFIASRGIGSTILDTLHLKLDTYYDNENFERKPLVELSNPALKRQTPYYLDIENITSYFTTIDTLQTTILGEFSFAQGDDTLQLKKPQVHFIKQKFGDGQIYLHLMPKVFSNYFMLREQNYVYTQNVLSYLPQDEGILWDNHHKNGKVIHISPLYLFLSNKYLKYAYYILIVAVLLWVLFEGRRKQRAIPIIDPLPNQTLSFTKTIAGMYLDRKDHKSIATHQINHFLEYIRSTYTLDTHTLNQAFITHLALKSNNVVEDTKKVINYIITLKSKEIIQQEELLQLNLLIEEFKK